MSDLVLNFDDCPSDDFVDEDFWNVNFWGSHPDEENDDCWSGETFTSREEAEKAFAAGSDDLDDCFVEIDGPGVNRVRKLREPRASRDNWREEWRQEIAREEGMLGGCSAYNEVMGY